MGVYLPGAILDPGAHWSGQAGWADVRAVVWHYTVGYDSRALIRNRGLAATLIRDEGIYQFAPLDAVCFTQCEWNRVVSGAEVESIDGSISDAEVAHLRYLTLFMLATFGIPPDFYDGPRLPVGLVFRGVTNHRNLVHRSCDQHYDGFGHDVWNAIVAPPPPTPEGSSDMFIVWMPDRGAFLVTPIGVLRRFTGPSGDFGICQAAHDWKATPGRDAVEFVRFDEPEFLAVHYAAEAAGI